MTRRLVVRLDQFGDVLLSGPAVRAVARRDPLTYLASSAGAAAAALLPGVERVLVYDAPWVSFRPPPVRGAEVRRLVEQLAALELDEAVVLTSWHQSPLPMALLLRLAGVGRISATSPDYPGSLLDVRGEHLADLHEVEQALHLVGEAGHHLDEADHGELRVRLPARAVDLPSTPYVVVHPGASVSSRALPIRATATAIAELADRGTHVVLTGSFDEAPLVDRLCREAGDPGVTRHVGDLGLAQLAHLLAGAQVLVAGNTGPAHLAAAVGTPVVQAFAPVVPVHRWRPWQVPHVVLGRTDVPCPRACSRGCVVVGQPCLDPFTPTEVVAAVEHLASAARDAGRVHEGVVR